MNIAFIATGQPLPRFQTVIGARLARTFAFREPHTKDRAIMFEWPLRSLRESARAAWAR
jgi:hypothetical protein